jgi:hypothetical protein
MGCPAAVISYGLEVAVKYCGSVKFQQLHHDGAGLCIPATSTSCSGFFCHQLHLNSWHVDSRSCVVASALSGHFSSCHFLVSCHLQLIAELFMKILSWACCLTTAMMDFSCLLLFFWIHHGHPLWHLFWILGTWQRTQKMLGVISRTQTYKRFPKETLCQKN